MINMNMLQRLFIAITITLCPSVLLAQNSGDFLPPIYPVFQLANGTTPAALGFVCTTASGTNNNQATYSNAALTSANANPVTLNASGRAVSGATLIPIYLQPLAYRITLYAAGTGNTCNGTTVGAQIWQRDGVYTLGALFRDTFATIMDDKVCHAAQITGTTPNDAGGKIRECIVNKLPSTGGTVDARGLEGAQTWSSDIFASVTKPVNLLLGTGTTTLTASTTVGTSITVVADRGAILSPNSGINIFLQGEFRGSMDQHFAGVGTVILNPGRTPLLYSEWWGALADGSTNNSTAIQAAITSLCGTASTVTPISQSGTGAHGALKFLQGVYVTQADITIPSACWADISGVSGKGTYIFQNSGGTTAAIQIQGSECIACSTPPRTSSNFDAEVHLHDLSIGSSRFHALQVLRGYRTKLSDINLFSAGTSSNYLDLDGVSVLVAKNIRTAGNDSFPYGQWYSLWCPGGTCGNAFTAGLRGVYITVRQGPTVGDYNLVGELFFDGLWVQGQQTQDAVFVDIPSAVDFNAYPIVIDKADLVFPATYAGVRANGQTKVVVSNSYMEAAGGTSDAIRVDSTQGSSTTLESAMVVVENSFSGNARLHLAGNGTLKPNLIVTGGAYSTFVSSSGVYGRLQLQNVEFTTNTASAYANYTNGDSTNITGNTVRVGATTVGVYAWNASFNDFAGETDPLVSRYTYASNATSAPIIECRKSRGTLTGIAAIQASDATCGFNFYGYSNGGWRDAGSFQGTVTAVSGSNLTGRLTFRLPAAGTSTVALILNPTNVVVGATDSNATALLNVNGGQVHIGSGAWPTTSLGQAVNNVTMSQDAAQQFIMYRSNDTVGTNYGGAILIGARQTDSTNDFAGVRFGGFRTNATSGNALAYATISTTNAGGTLVEGLRVDGAQLTTLAAGLTVTGTVTFVSLTSSSTGDYVCWNTGTGVVTQSTSCTLSSERYKHDITYDGIPGLDLVRQMRPISFIRNDHPEMGVRYGFKAEDVARIEPRLTLYDAQGRPNSFEYENYTAVLTKAVQELDERVRRLERR